MDFQLPLELFVEDNVGIADNKKGHLKIQDGTCFDPLSSYFKGREKKRLVESIAKPIFEAVKPLLQPAW